MIECHPADFTEWLSGKGSASNPPGWAWRDTPAGVTVGPGHGRIITLMLVMAAMFAGGVGFLIFISRVGPADGFASIGNVVIGIGLAGAAILLAVLAVYLARDQRAGPYVMYRPGRRTFELPRANLVLPAAQVRRWRVVTGNWVGSKNVQTRRDSARSELHLIVDTPVGSTAYLICAWLRASLADSLRDLAAATGLPLEIVDQPDIEYRADTARLRDAE